MICSVCGTENEAGRKFCGECGSPLALSLACAVCGTANSPGMKFCGECGSPLLEGAVPRTPAPDPDQPDAERRLVSVLFADLVGFTTLSESRDPEEVRDLLSRYFETCRQLIDRYGGVVEKFIGDAVMAVWGTPTAQEDDAERAVRAGLELVEAVAAMGEEVGAPDLRARAGVLTGEAAVTLQADGQGMVAGDLVNTASRIQSAAEPGTVLTGDTTRRASEAAIIYEDAGQHELKGKAEPQHLHRAVRVIGGRGGALRSTGLEAPFVGRDRELRLLKELFHASADECTAHLLSVIGVAGIGKSRLSWEFFKYLDGLAATTYWHRGRSLAYGEGVTYWALAEMLRGRAGIAEGESQQDATAKLRASLEEHVHDPDERRWIEPRLAQLLGLEERTAAEREDLFAAARLFFERMTERYPVVLVFEDMQWAEPALVDFIEYLLDWSRTHPLFVLALGRPEVAERHPGWPSNKRNFTSLFLEPLPPSAMDSMLDRPRAGTPARGSRTDTRPCGGRSPVRRRDGAHADRPRPAGARGQRIPAGTRARRGPRRPGDPARPHRRAARRARPARAALPPGRQRARQDVLEAGGRGDHRPARGGDRGHPHLRSCARRCSRCRPTRGPPSAGSTGSSRTSCGGSRTRPCRSASARSATWPRPTTSRAARTTGNRRSSRWWPPTCSTRTRSRRMRTTRVRSSTGPARRSPWRAGAPPRSPRTRRRSGTSNGRRGSPTTPSNGAGCSSRPATWPGAPARAT